MRFFGMLAIALFWNGITSVFVYHALDSFRTSQPEWFLTIFITPFVLVGLGLIGGVFYQALAWRNPVLRVTAPADGVALGAELAFAWEFTGQTQRLRGLAIELQGLESATYTRGTNTVTDREVFARESSGDDRPRGHPRGSRRGARAGGFDAHLRWRQ